MPGIELLRSPVFLVGGLSVLILLIVILLARRTYWDLSGVSKRKRRRLESVKPRIVLIIACITTSLTTILLALAVNIAVAISFAGISFLIIVIVFSASGRGDGKSSTGNVSIEYLDGRWGD